MRIFYILTLLPNAKQLQYAKKKKQIKSYTSSLHMWKEKHHENHIDSVVESCSEKGVLKILEENVYTIPFLALDFPVVRCPGKEVEAAY